MESILANRSTETLKQAAKLAMASSEESSDLALSAIMNVLEDRMVETDYITFCNDLVESF